MVSASWTVSGRHPVHWRISLLVIARHAPLQVIPREAVGRTPSVSARCCTTAWGISWAAVESGLPLEVLEQDGDPELVDPTPMGQERLLLGQKSKVLG